MKPATRLFIRQRFSDYYDKTRIYPPSSVEQREFGFIFFEENYPDNIWMRRHMGFSSGEMMQDYLKSLVPAHAYYSTAYYRTPQAPVMGEKDWLGADLIFDLDADHIMRGSYEDMLARIKEETLKLLSILDCELGIDMRTVKLVFSGGRGYHVHIQEIAFRDFGSQERRELIDYLCGTGINPSILLREWQENRRGWHERYRTVLISYLNSLQERTTGEAEAELAALKGIGSTYAERFVRMIPDLINGLNKRPSSILLRDQTIHRVFNALSAERESPMLPLIHESAVQPDEPVTTDVRRLIRLPGSLHAKSGFKAIPLEIKDFESFDPLVDAVAFGDRSIPVNSPKEYEISMLGSRYDVPKGESKVPEAVALFLCCRGMADIGGGSGSAS